MLAQQGRCSALLAKAAIGLLRNVSCVGEEGLLREMIALGVLQAVCESYLGGQEEGRGALAEDASFAEDCVLCACNMLRMVAAGASSSSSSSIGLQRSGPQSLTGRCGGSFSQGNVVHWCLLETAARRLRLATFQLTKSRQTVRLTLPKVMPGI